MTDAAPDTEAPASKGRPPAELAFDTWRVHKDGFRELAKRLHDMGYDLIAPATLMRMKDVHREWLKEWTEYQHFEGGPKRTLQILAAAYKQARELKADHLLGIKGQLIARLFEQIQSMSLDTVEDLQVAVEVLGKLDALIHSQRGLDLGDGKAAGAAIAPNGKTQLVSMPKPQIAPIKAPAPKGAH